ncbi:MAG: methyltransferase domain-containing protein [Sandaracinaceae bacterium]|nr:methyltransferase domain-containing protein [Sandaracinaceae bacterium]
MSRRVAMRVLYRVAEEGAYAAVALDAELRRAGLRGSDAALATEIVYGALRALPAIDAALDARLRSPSTTDPLLRAALRVGAYQLLYLDRVPAHAAVGETVTACREARGAKLAGVANAVLRRLARERPAVPATASLMLPAWIERCVRDGLGEPRADVFLGPRRLPPPLGLRFAEPPDDAALAALAAAGGEATRSALAPRGVAVRGVGDPRALPGYAEGRFSVQELGAQLVVARAGAQPGERVADLCAGHGTKTLALAEEVGPSGRVVAVDLYEEKLARLELERARLGIAAERVEARAVDLTRGLGGLAPKSFDRVLLDAPCTGLGTIHRRPELALRLRPEDPARLGGLARALALRAAELVRDGGTLVLATCSAAREEGPALADALGSPAASVDVVGPWLGEELDVYHVLTWRR